MHLKKEFNLINFDTLDLVNEVKYEREINREFYKKFSSDSILKGKNTKNGEGKEDNEILDN